MLEQVQDDIRPSSMDAGAILNLQKELLAGLPSLSIMHVCVCRCLRVWVPACVVALGVCVRAFAYTQAVQRKSSPV